MPSVTSLDLTLLASKRCRHSSDRHVVLHLDNYTVDIGAIRAGVNSCSPHRIPSWSLAVSDILLAFQGGSQTTSTLAVVTPGMACTLEVTSAGSDCAAGQPGEVRVILTLTAPEASTWIS